MAGTTEFLQNLIAGGVAGLSVDLMLYPIDTLKTRLQSPQGFLASGGFRGVYNGVGAVGVGSSPGSAMFFTIYEGSKPYTTEWCLQNGRSQSLGHMLSASAGEVCACFVRVPTEVIKSHMQTNSKECSTVFNTVKFVMNGGGGGGGGVSSLYRGFGVTIFREIPFAFIQFPIYERLKSYWGDKMVKKVSAVEAAVCGSIGGAIAAAATTPLDVMKTRMMLGVDAEGVNYTSMVDTARRIAAKEGVSTFFNGVQPRVMWISIGGFIFFGAFESFKSIIGK